MCKSMTPSQKFVFRLKDQETPNVDVFRKTYSETKPK